MMKRKRKVLVEEQIEKPIKKIPTSKAKGAQKMLQWMKMDLDNYKWAKQIGLEGLFNI
jgi:hypothetical protein